MMRRSLVLGASIALIVLVVGLGAWASASTSSGLKGVGSASFKVVKPSVNLLKDVKPLRHPAKLLQLDTAAARSMLHSLVEREGNALAGVHVLEVHGRKLVVAFTGNGVVVVDPETGQRLPARLQLLHTYTESGPAKVEIDARYAEDTVHALSGKVELPAAAEKAVIGNYSSLKAFYRIVARSYLLEAKLDGARYEPLAYYVYVSASYSWYLGGHLVYRVTASGWFYVNPGSVVYAVGDTSHYTVNPPYSNCRFSHSKSQTPVSASIRADGTAALLDCPVTTKLNAWALVAVDKWGNIFTSRGGSKWIAIGCGCNSYP